jgi:hypothetical protein
MKQAVDKDPAERLPSNKGNISVYEGGSFCEEEIPRYPAEGKNICWTGGFEENLANLRPQ